MKNKSDWNRKQRIQDWMDFAAWIFLGIVFFFSLAFMVYGILKLFGLVY